MDYSWQASLGAALVETDLQKLPGLIAAAEKAIFFRAQELSKSNNGRTESDALQAAVQQLLIFKTERLKWPNLVTDGAHG